MAARARGGCARCGGTRRQRRSQRRHEVLVDCTRCFSAVCERHSHWHPEWSWLCNRCAREVSA